MIETLYYAALAVIAAAVIFAVAWTLAAFLGASSDDP